MAPPPPCPRPLAICIFRKEDQVFVGELYDASKDEVFYRPLGGTIEFGEPAREAVKRELQEEIEAEAINLRYLGALENLFTHEGEFGHEIVLVYEGDFADKAFYEAEAVPAQEEDGMTFTACWKPLQEFREGKAPLYPDGLLRLLSSPGKLPDGPFGHVTGRTKTRSLRAAAPGGLSARGGGSRPGPTRGTQTRPEPHR